MSQYQTAVRENPEDWMRRWRFALLLNKGLNDLEAEEIQLWEIIKYCPYNFAYLVLGQNLHKQGKLAEAIKVLYQLLEMKPTSSQAHFELARIFRKSKDNKGAIKHLSEGIKIAPLESPGVYTSLARIYHKAKKTGKAVKILNKAIDIFPEEETAHVRVGLSNMLSAQGKYDQALKELQLALRINPNYAYDKLFQEKLKILKEKSAP